MIWPSVTRSLRDTSNLLEGWYRILRRQINSRHCEERSDEAIHSATCRQMDCFAEPVIRRRFAPTGWLAMTVVRSPHIEHDAGDDEHRRHRQHLRERFRGRPLGGFLHVYLPRLGRDSPWPAKARSVDRMVTRNTPRR